MSQSVQAIVSEYVTAAAVVAVVNTKFVTPKFPRVGATISALCAISPLDLAKLVSDFQSLFPGGTAAMAAKRLKANKDMAKIANR